MAPPSHNEMLLGSTFPFLVEHNREMRGKGGGGTPAVIGVHDGCSREEVGATE